MLPSEFGSIKRLILSFFSGAFSCGSLCRLATGSVAGICGVKKRSWYEVGSLVFDCAVSGPLLLLVPGCAVS